MILIIEGLDGVGKTTFCKQFAELFSFEYTKGIKTDDNDEKVKIIGLLKDQLKSRKNYIYDRITLIDDFVYSFLNEECKPNVLNDHFSEIQDLLKKCIIVHLFVDEDVRVERFNRRGDEYVTNQDMQRVSKAYVDIYKKLGCQINFIPLDKDTNNKIIKIILNR